MNYIISDYAIYVSIALVEFIVTVTFVLTMPTIVLTMQVVHFLLMFVKVLFQAQMVCQKVKKHLLSNNHPPLSYQK